jgi:hypothetical protein
MNSSLAKFIREHVNDDERRLQSLPQVQNFVGAVGLRHDLHHCALDDLSNYQMLKRRERKKWVSCKGH